MYKQNGKRKPHRPSKNEPVPGPYPQTKDTSTTQPNQRESNDRENPKDTAPTKPPEVTPEAESRANMNAVINENNKDMASSKEKETEQKKADNVQNANKKELSDQNVLTKDDIEGIDKAIHENYSISMDLAARQVAQVKTMKAREEAMSRLTQQNTVVELKTYKLTDSGKYKIVNKLPRIMELVNENQYYGIVKMFGENVPVATMPNVITTSQQMFQVGTTRVRVRINAVNGANPVQYDPITTLSGPPLFAASYYTNSRTAPAKFLSYISGVLNLILQLATCMRVTLQSPDQVSHLDLGSNELGIRILEGTSFIDDGIPQVMFGSVGHPLQWFKERVNLMMEDLRRGFGEVGPTLSNGGNFKVWSMHVAGIDNLAALLYSIHQSRIQSRAIDINDYLRAIRAIAPLDTFVHCPHAGLSGVYWAYMPKGFDSESWILLYLISEKFRNKQFLQLEEYIQSFGIFSIVNIRDELSAMVTGARMADGPILSFVQERYNGLTLDVVFRMFTLLLCCDFYRPNFQIQIPGTARVENIMVLIDIMTVFVLFPQLARSNLYQFAYPLYQIFSKFVGEELGRFHQTFGFSNQRTNPGNITRDQWMQGEIPSYFTAQPAMHAFPFFHEFIRLIAPIGEVIRVKEDKPECFPQFDEVDEIYCPWPMIQRTEYDVETPLSNRLRDIDVFSRNTMNREIRRNGEVRDNTRNHQSGINFPRGEMTALNNLLALRMENHQYIGRTLCYDAARALVMMANQTSHVYCGYRGEDVYNPPFIGVGAPETFGARNRRAVNLDLQINITVGTSMVMCLQGIKPRGDGTIALPDVQIEGPEPLKIYQRYVDEVIHAKSVSEAIVTARWFLRNGALPEADFFSENLRGVIKASNFNAIITHIFKIRNLDIEDLFSEFMGNTTSHNDPRYYDYRVCFINVTGQTVERPNSPAIMNRDLRLSDDFYNEELSTVTRFVLTPEGPFLHRGRGLWIVYGRQYDMSPINLPPIDHMEAVEYDELRWELRQINQRSVVVLIHNGVEYMNEAEYPYLAITINDTAMIPPERERCILQGIREKRFGVYLADLKYAAATQHIDRGLASTFEPSIEEIFRLSNVDFPFFVFGDTTTTIANPEYEIDENMIIQMLYTNVNLVSDRIAGGILGVRPGRTFVDLDPEHWELGEVAEDGIPRNRFGIAKLNSGKPNFLNAIRVLTKHALFEPPPVTIIKPHFY